MIPRKRCENCTQWSSTDQVWGHCVLASSRDDGEKIAHATWVRLGDEHQATLETRYDFGCVVWKSLNAVLRSIRSSSDPGKGGET